MECTTCHQTENLYEKKYRLKDDTIRYWYLCRECNTKAMIKYRQSDKGKAASYRASRKYYLANKERNAAWMKAQKLPNKPCEICQATKADKHHPDIKMPLVVVYLCRLHHKQAHKLMV